MENPLKELFNQLAENIKKAPGWLPLLILCYVGFHVLPEGATIFGLCLKPHAELIVPGVTLLFYVLGDLLDKPLFKPLTRRLLLKDQQKAKDALELEKDGIYRVSKSLASAAKKYDGSWIRVKNESAKLLRSLVIPSAGMGIFLLFRCQVAFAVAGVAGGIVFFFLYIQLKASHMKDLYALSEELARDTESYEAHNLSKKARLFFWKGELVSSGQPPHHAAPANNP